MRRRGFTLIELVVSLGVVSILITAIGSSIVIATRTLPTAGGMAETQAAAGRVLLLLGEDIRFSTTTTVTNGRHLDLSLPDRTGDAAEETVRYAWSGSSGDPLVRTYNGVDNELLASIDNLSFTATTRASFDADGRTSTPADRLTVELTTSDVNPVSVSGEFRLFNSRVAD
ncbi:MAG: hypothetical protein Phyf2KO_02290 [Phycisphaerales bacterium]